MDSIVDNFGLAGKGSARRSISLTDIPGLLTWKASALAQRLGAKDQGVAAARAVDEVGWDFERAEQLAQPADVVADLFREEGGIGPGLA